MQKNNLFKRNFKRNKEQYIIYAIVAVMILAGVFTFISQQNTETLPVYTQSDKVETADTSKDEEDELDIEMSEYTDEVNHFTIQIPSDWQQVTKNGYVTFIHGASGSSIQIQTSEYDPSINNVEQSTLSTQVAEDGKTFTSFTRLSSSSYELIYQDYQNSTYDYMEEVYWDREAIVKLVCTFNDQNYEKILPYYKKIMNSFVWDKQKPIPEEYGMYYNEAAKFEIAVPLSWTLSAVDSSVVAMDNETGATMSMSIMNNSTYLDSITATDISSLLKGTKTNFIMQGYQNSKDNATVNSTYVVDSVQVQNTTYIFANGTYLYFISFDYEKGTIDDELPLNCAKTFKEFITNTTGESVK